jgi:hypothetical protein
VGPAGADAREVLLGHLDGLLHLLLGLEQGLVDHVVRDSLVIVSLVIVGWFGFGTRGSAGTSRTLRGSACGAERQGTRSRAYVLLSP